MLGNQAVARGLYEAGVDVVSTRAHPAPKLPSLLLNMMISTLSGRQTRRLPAKLPLVPASAAHVHSAQ